ncbi:MAG: ThiF family adenylyltransferase [Candidatus Obscuribacterales bacterium]|jgi:molybdopterin/thiamine biosynthesis adenylyltransferase|nr:ThiF family adenylyltransferase [Candidatus Obscuribacterales bacterium]
MQEQVPLALSRFYAAISDLGSSAPEAHKFRDKTVALISSSSAISSRNARYILLSSIRLLSRLCGQITVHLPEAALEAKSECEALSELEGVEFFYESSSFCDYRKYDAVLCVENFDSEVNHEGTITFVGSYRWLAQISSKPIRLPQEDCDFNPIAAYGAACIAVADVFKELLQVKATRASKLDDLCFSFYSLSAGLDGGASLKGTRASRMLLIGAGAIGSAVAYILREMPLYGLLDIVDYQKYGIENLATTIYLNRHDIGKSKSAVAANYASNHLIAVGHEAKLEDWLRTNQSPLPIVLAALDNIPARHFAQQSIWPDILIDGATGSFLSQVIIHRWSATDPCLLCLFEEPVKSSDADQVAAVATGLSVTRATQRHSNVTVDDVNAAPVAQREWLKQRIGKEICSVIQEGIASSISSESQPSTFAPAAPFVAGLSACMMVASLYRYLEAQAPEFNRFQFDALIGPAAGQHYKEVPKPGCVCQTRRTNIEAFRNNQF